MWTGKGAGMPEKETRKRAEKDKREGKARSTQAGEFVRIASDRKVARRLNLLVLGDSILWG
jgi:hypothetical protein